MCMQWNSIQPRKEERGHITFWDSINEPGKHCAK